MWLRRICWPCYLSCRSAAVSFLGSRFRKPRKAWLLVFFLRCVYRGLFENLVTFSEESYREFLCLTLFNLGTSTNSHPSPQFGCSTTERKEHKVYLQALELQLASSSSSSTVRFFSRMNLFECTFQKTFCVL
jgi:hypothetical protein